MSCKYYEKPNVCKNKDFESCDMVDQRSCAFYAKRGKNATNQAKKTAKN